MHKIQKKIKEYEVEKNEKSKSDEAKNKIEETDREGENEGVAKYVTNLQKAANEAKPTGIR